MNKEELNAYKQAHAKANYTHIHLKIPNYLTEVLEMLESVDSKNGYIVDLIEKDIEQKKRDAEVLTEILGIPQRGHGEMRNERILLDCPRGFRYALTKGKPSGSSTLAFHWTDEMLTKDYWRRLFTEAIEDLEAGNRFEGKGARNTVGYWRKQLEELESI